MLARDPRKAQSEEIQQMRNLGHAWQDRIVPHHENTLLRQAVDQRLLRVGKTRAENGDRWRQDQAFPAVLGMPRGLLLIWSRSGGESCCVTCRQDDRPRSLMRPYARRMLAVLLPLSAANRARMSCFAWR
jgi:hypothetical protein